MINSIQPFVHDPHSTVSNNEIFLLDFQIHSKASTLELLENHEELFLCALHYT